MKIQKKNDVFEQRGLENVLEKLYNEINLEKPIVENEFMVSVLSEINLNINWLELHGEDTTNTSTESDCNIRLIKFHTLIPVGLTSLMCSSHVFFTC